MGAGAQEQEAGMDSYFLCFSLLAETPARSKERGRAGSVL